MVPIPAIPATRASADAVDRLSYIPTVEVKVSDKSILDKTASRAQLSGVLGGAATRTCVSVNSRNLLYPSHEFQPWRPSKPGGPGLLLYPTPEQPWQGDVQTVFVALYMAKYRYAGEYRLMADEPLSPDEFTALPLAVSVAPSSQTRSESADLTAYRPNKNGRAISRRRCSTRRSASVSRRGVTRRARPPYKR